MTFLRGAPIKGVFKDGVGFCGTDQRRQCGELPMPLSHELGFLPDAEADAPDVVFHRRDGKTLEESMSTTDLGTAATAPSAQRKRRAPGDPREQLLSGLPVSERRLRLAGIGTTVLEGGEGPPMVLLHGSGEHAAKWFRIIPELVNTHRVIAPDLPGHGASEAFDGPVHSEAMLAWLGELIEHTCKTRPIVVGQIIGGALAARFAAAHGDGLRCLVMSDALGLRPFQPTPEFGAALMAFVSEPSPENHDRLWQRCAFDLDALRSRVGEKWDRLRAYNLDRAQVPHLKPTQQALMEQFGFPAIPEDELARIRTPTFLIWGRHDLATPLAVAEAASGRYGWQLHVIDNAADDPPIEQPEAFVRVLRAALAEIKPADGGLPPDTRAAWDRIAPGYDRTNTETQLWLGNEGIRRAGLHPGMRFLDVASGNGALSIPAARMGAKVTAIDQSPAMLELLSKRAEREGLPVVTRVMDGHALAFDDDRFDMAGSQFGVMLFPDMPRGIREMARVVKPGGRVLVIAYGVPHEIEFLRFFVEAIRTVRPDFDGPPMEPLPLPFQLCDPARLRFELEGAGLSSVDVETMTEKTEFKTGESLWEWIVWSNPIAGEVLQHLAIAEREVDTIQQALEDLVHTRAKGSDKAVLSNPINVGIGVK
jgi:pimeloyl-ACP methyl ester carboxylesterase/SAM-dependent methyltransferase